MTLVSLYGHVSLYVFRFNVIVNSYSDGETQYSVHLTTNYNKLEVKQKLCRPTVLSLQLSQSGGERRLIYLCLPVLSLSALLIYATRPSLINATDNPAFIQHTAELFKKRPHS